MTDQRAVWKSLEQRVDLEQRVKNDVVRLNRNGNRQSCPSAILKDIK
jgi:hypothetical protein